MPALSRWMALGQREEFLLNITCLLDYLKVLYAACNGRKETKLFYDIF